jgi:hypothetical protein
VSSPTHGRHSIQPVKRNIERFPEDFMFRLKPEDTTVILKGGAIKITICDL